MCRGHQQSGENLRASQGSLMLAESQGCILCDCPGSPCILIVYLVPATRVSGPEKPPCTGLAERSCSGL